jgi:hypothetical protein
MNKFILKEYVHLIIKESILSETNLSTNNEETFGDLKKALSAYVESQASRDKIKNNKKIGVNVARIALDFIPFVGAIANTAELVGTLMTIEDDKRPKGFLSNFDLDDYTSKIVDNKLEVEFIKHILAVIKNKNENDLIKDFNMTEEFNEFLKSKFDGRHIEGYK